MAKKIKILALRPLEKPVVEEIEDSLEAMQKFVGGYIQSVPVGDGLDMILDEEGKLKGKPYNRSLFDGQDVAVGDVFITKVNSNGNSVSLTQSDIDKYMQKDVMVFSL